jgi:hypothetical protein
LKSKNKIKLPKGADFTVDEKPVKVSALFAFMERRAMLVRYKKNRKNACYDSDTLITTGKIQPEERPCGPFESCGNCPYPSHGFICYSSEGDCLRNDINKIHRKNRKEESRC